MPQTKVYILGAGCSKHCGYPLGPEVRSDLESLGRSLDSGSSPRLKRAIADTVALLGRTTETVDILVQKLYGGQFDDLIGGPSNRQPRVISATLTTAAAFIAREPSARETGFARYREFLSDLFAGSQNQWALMPQPTHCHVLSFNYDRMFEIAFLDRFNIDNYGLYDIRVLNSGVTLPGVEIEFTPEAFSFLKLHGSVCGWAIDLTGFGHPQHQRFHFEKPQPGESVRIKDDYFFAEPPDGQHPDRLKRQALLYFPFQRQFIVSNESGFAFHKYARGVWDRAKELIANATEIRVIGYHLAVSIGFRS